MRKKLPTVELFTGAGGLAIGLHKAGLQAQVLVEYNEDACKTVNENINRGFGAFGSSKVILSDVRSVDFSSLHGQAEVVAGGPPCQPFSLGGKHKGMDDTRDMFPQAVRAVREIRPKAFIFENVKGLLRTSFAPYYKYVIQQLSLPFLTRKKGETWQQHSARLAKELSKTRRDIGESYRVVFQLFNAAEYGVPQYRHRVFIVGFRDDLGLQWEPPKPTHSYESLLKAKWASGEYWDFHKISVGDRPHSPKGLTKLISEWQSQLTLFPERQRMLTVRDAIGDLPQPSRGSDPKPKVLNHEFREGAKSYPGHTGSPIDEPAKALKAGDHGVPGGENMVVLPDQSVRYFTVRESARIQTFPDDYFITGSWTEAMRQLGNAVPVRLAEVVGQSVLQHLSSRSK